MKEIPIYKKYLMEAILFFTYATFAITWKTGDWLIASLGFEKVQIALMTNAINLAKIIGSLSAAYVISRIGYKKIYSYATFLVILGVSIVFSDSFTLIFLIRFILGLGGALILVSISPIVASLFKDSELAVVNGLNAVAFNVGLAVSLTFYAQIAPNAVQVLYILSSLLAVAVILWLFITRGYLVNAGVQDTSNKEKSNYTVLDGMKDRFNWVYAIAYSGILGFYLVSFTFMDPAIIKYVIYAGVVGALIGTFTAKYFIDKLKLVRISAVLQLASTILFMLYYSNPFMGKLLGLAVGFTIFFAMPAFVTLAFIRKNVTPVIISVTFSIFWSFSYFASIIYVQAYAYLAQNMGLSVANIFITAVASTFFVGTIFFIKKNEEVKAIN